MTRISLKYTDVVLLTFGILGILVVVNFLSSRHFTRIDLTETKEFSLASSTKEALKRLDDIVSVKVYFSEKLPSYLVNLRRQVYDLLDEYKAYGKGNIDVEYIDPAKDPKVEQTVRLLGIPQLQVNIIEKDQAQLANVYLGMAVMFEAKKSIIPVVDSMDTLEYDLTSAIVKVTKDDLETVGLLAEYGPHTIDQDYTIIQRALEEQYKVVEVHLKEGKEVPKEVDTLVVAGCKEIDEEAKFSIDQFVMHGGKILFLVDPIEIKEGTLQGTKINSQLDDLLEQYGIKLNKDLVLDLSNAMASFSSGFVRFYLHYPLWPKVLKQNFSRDYPMVSELESLILPWTSSMEASQEEGDLFQTTTLAKTTPHAWCQRRYFDLNPRQNFRAPASDKGVCSLAILSSGRFKSFYSDRDIPKSKEGTGNVLKEGEGQVVVVGNSKFITNWFLSQFPENQVFFLNVIDWLTMGEELIGIRSRMVTDRPLRMLTDRQKTLVKFLGIFLIPCFVGLYGLIHFYFRRKKKVATPYGI